MESDRKHWASEEMGRKERKKHCFYKRTVEMETCHDRNMTEQNIKGRMNRRAKRKAKEKKRV